MLQNEYLDECIKELRASGKRNPEYSELLLRSYLENQDLQIPKLTIFTVGFGEDIEEFTNLKNMLIKANIKEFILVDTSTALLRGLHTLDSIGLKIKGVEVTKKYKKWDEVWEDIQGLKIVIE